MAVSVLLSGTLKDGMVDQFTQMCSDSLDGTRKSDGCQNINLTYHTKEPNKFVLTEVWDSKAKYMEYVALRRDCLLYTSPSPRDGLLSRMPSSA